MQEEAGDRTKVGLGLISGGVLGVGSLGLVRYFCDSLFFVGLSKHLSWVAYSQIINSAAKRA